MDLKTLQQLQVEIEEMLNLLDIDFVKPAVEVDEEEILKVDLQTNSTALSTEQDHPNLGILIGPRGETLAAIEYLLALMINRDRDEWLRVQVDVDGYREKRTDTLVELANKMAEKAIRFSEPVTMHPMPSFERRIVHTTLSDKPGVVTESTGEGRHRRVVIKPK